MLLLKHILYAKTIYIIILIQISNFKNWYTPIRVHIQTYQVKEIFTMKLTIKKEIDTEDLQKLQTITELMYTAKALYRNVSELHSQICHYQDKTISDTSLDAALAFNKLYDVLQKEQKNLLKNIEVDVHKAI